MNGKAIERILVVDDEESQCRMVQQVLQKQGYVCEATNNPLEALARMSNRHYDVVISDIKMEEKEGLELLRETRSEYPDTDFIIMTGFTEEYSYARIIDAGARDFLAKPFPVGELLAKIKRIERERRTEESLNKYRDHLEELVQRRTAELARTNERLQEEIAERKRMEASLKESEARVRRLNEDILHMLMVMSHDIRGPLVAIAATVKLLLRGVYGKLDQSVGNTVKDLLGRIVQLSGIAEDCLGKAYAVDGSMKMDRETFDLRQGIIDPILDEISHDIEKYKITIDNRLGSIPAGSIPIKASRTWLKAVFRNLFKNAVKYGGNGCTIAFGFEDGGSFYRLNVYNTGSQVPEEDRERLFTKFGRINASDNRTTDGIGLGLYLIREIIRKHGGDIWYEARPEGSDFVFTIPK